MVFHVFLCFIIFFTLVLEQRPLGVLAKLVQKTLVSSACWLFQSCVRHECKREQGIAVGNCFDGVCVAGENADNCPADCCPAQKNHNYSLSSLESGFELLWPFELLW